MLGSAEETLTANPFPLYHNHNVSLISYIHMVSYIPDQLYL